jgi:hypothetical protein
MQESKSIDEARAKLQEKKDQLLQTEAKYNEQLLGLQMNLDAELSERKRVHHILRYFTCGSACKQIKNL